MGLFNLFKIFKSHSFRICLQHDNFDGFFSFKLVNLSFFVLTLPIILITRFTQISISCRSLGLDNFIANSIKNLLRSMWPWVKEFKSNFYFFHWFLLIVELPSEETHLQYIFITFSKNSITFLTQLS